MEKKILIAYYSWSGNTKKVAELVSGITGGELFEIKPRDAYPDGYDAVVEQAKREIKEGYMPELAGMPAGIEGYDTVFVGSPNWWSTIAPPVAAFLDRAGLAGKTIAPFCSHGGGGKAGLFRDIAAVCGGADVAEGLAAYNGNVREGEITAWLERTGIK
jgi:flavodoxin